jgi:hypothetical protein
MIDPVSSVRGVGASKRVRGRRKGDGAAAAADGAPAEAATGPRPATPIPPTSADREPPPAGVAAQILGQSGSPSDTAEGAGSAKIAQTARTAYLGVEYSGGADRRHRLGKIAKTKI